MFVILRCGDYVLHYNIEFTNAQTGTGGLLFGLIVVHWLLLDEVLQPQQRFRRIRFFRIVLVRFKFLIELLMNSLCCLSSRLPQPFRHRPLRYRIRIGRYFVNSNSGSSCRMLQLPKYVAVLSFISTGSCRCTFRFIYRLREYITVQPAIKILMRESRVSHPGQSAEAVGERTPCFFLLHYAFITFD